MTSTTAPDSGRRAKRSGALPLIEAEAPPRHGAPVMLFDGVCNVCNAGVQFVLRYERSPSMRFAALQSDEGRALIAQHGLPDNISTVVVIDDTGRAHTRSSAAVRILRVMGGPWTVLAWL